MDKRISILIFGFFFIFWFSVFIGSGSLFSGYHLADDNDVLIIDKALVSTQNDIIGVIKQWVMHDLNIMHRFKPVYYLHRVMETLVYGTNINLWLFHTGLLAVLTSFFLFTFMHKIGFSLFESVLFPLLSLVGSQAVIWWSLGPNETIGMFFLSLALLAMSFSIYSEKRINRIIGKAFFIIFSIFMSLSKESFILLVPALLFWRTWLYKEKTSVAWFVAVKSDFMTSNMLFAVMLFELFIIVKWAGVGGHGEASGGISGFTPLLYLKTAKDVTFSVSTIGLGLVSFAGIALMFLSDSKGSNAYQKFKKFAGDIYCPAILSVLVAGPQIIIYTKSGIFGRYLLPCIAGYSIFLIYLLRYLRVNKERYFIKLFGKEMRTSYPLFLAVGISLILGGVVLLSNKEITISLLSFFGRQSSSLKLSDALKPGVLILVAGISMCLLILVSKKKFNKGLPTAHIVVIFSIMLISYKAMISIAEAYEFALEGESIQELHRRVEKNTNADDLILVVSDPRLCYDYEASFSLKAYLNSMVNRKRIYLYPLFSGENCDRDSKATDYGEKFFNGNTLISIKDKGNIKLIIIFRKVEQKFLSNSRDWFNSATFSREDNGFFVVYYKDIRSINLLE